MHYLYLFIFACLVSVGTVSHFGAERIDIPGPAGSGAFGETVKVLPNGNFVVVDYVANLPITEVGAVYLYNGATRQLISRLHGTHYYDHVGNGGINVLPSGDFIVRSPDWQSKRGAVTFCSKTTGCNGAVDAANSLVGADANTFLGSADPLVLENGNYVIKATGYIFRGSVTLCSGTSPTVGVVSAENSLIGERPADRIGSEHVTPLSNGGYVIESPDWNDGRGAVTFCDGVTGCKGLVSSANSLVGNPGDRVGFSSRYMQSAVYEVGDGNYLVESKEWKNNGITMTGAVTWLSPSTGLHGVVSQSNSLVGTERNTVMTITVLKNGNYVVLSQSANTGGATFGNGNIGIFGPIAAHNSLLGTGTNNAFNPAVVTPLENGNYVVCSPTWRSPDLTTTGAATFCNGITGCTSQTVTESNSVIGVGGHGPDPTVTPLANGNYVVKSYFGSTFGNGTTGVAGRVTLENSLISPNWGGLGHRIVALPNGNYYVLNGWWDPAVAPDRGYRGAVTFGDGQTGTVGIVSEANSLVNERSGDADEFSTKLLPSGNLLLLNSRWNGNRGSITMLSSTTARTGVISAQNSLVGSNPNDYLGSTVVVPQNSNYVPGSTVNMLENGNYVVVAHNWGGGRGAVRVCPGDSPRSVN